MPTIEVKLKRTITLNVPPDDDSDLQLAAMVLAIRDSHIELLSEMSNKPLPEIEQMIDAAYERYMEDFLLQIEERREALS